MTFLKLIRYKNLLMVLLTLFRLFWNSILAYIFIYIDIVVCQGNSNSNVCTNLSGGNGGAGIVLVCIAIYSTTQMFLKLVLAMGHHISWMLCNCCRGTLEEDRRDKVNRLWGDLKREYAGIQE